MAGFLSIRQMTASRAQSAREAVFHNIAGFTRLFHDPEPHSPVQCGRPCILAEHEKKNRNIGFPQTFSQDLRADALPPEGGQDKQTVQVQFAVLAAQAEVPPPECRL